MNKQTLTTLALLATIFSGYLLIEQELTEKYLKRVEFEEYAMKLHTSHVTAQYVTNESDIEHWEALIDNGHNLKPWELRLYRKALKERERVKALLNELGEN